MTGPFLPPPKSLDGITLREALSYERTVDNGEPVPPPGGVAETPDDSMAVSAGGWLHALKLQGAAAFPYFPAGEDWRDARGRSHIRIVANVHEAGAVDARLVAKFTTSATASSSDPTLWTHAGALGTEVPVSMAVAGTQRSEDWIPLHADARAADARWQVFGVGGDGVETPVVSDVQIQWRTGVELPTEKLFWRQLSPATQPAAWTGDEQLSVFSTVPEQTEYTGLSLIPSPPQASGPFSGGWPSADCIPPLDVEAYTTPTRSTVFASVGLLTQTKNTTDAGITGVSPLCDDAHKNAIGPVKRFVGRPLAAQAVAAFAYEHWCSSSVVSAVTTGAIASRLWVWRPGVGRVLLGELDYNDEDGFPVTQGRYAQSTSGGPGQKYVLTVGRVVRNWGRFPAFTALAGDRFILDVWSYVKTDCGFADQTQGRGAGVGYNGTTVPSDPEGLAAWAGTASHTVMPRLVYAGLV